ncbi:hypothetical protein BK006_00860 [bacterium CG10_49_38]|nr:MAG: hypothetical protein BK006_00860 [bacterium CG10_49_38]
MQEALLKFFPVPKFLTQPVVGLDVSDNSIKFMELSRRGQGFRLGRWGEWPVPTGLIDGGEIKNPDGFKELLNQFKAKHGFDQVAISLPDDHAYTINLTLPSMKPEEILGSIELQLEEYIPLPAASVVFDFDLVEATPTGPIEVGISALPRTVVEGHEQLFAVAGFDLLSLETQGEALARALTSRQEKKNLLIADLGGNHTAIFWVKNGVVIHASASPIGGEAITQNLQKTLGVDRAAAEKIKINQGMSRADENKNVFEAIIPVVSAIREEMSRRISFWVEKKEGEEETLVDKILLIGGQSSLPGLVEYLSVNLERPIELANPWIKVFPAGTVVPDLSYNESLRYGTAIGLALLNFEQ